ncbi:MAG TPA: FAD-binding oxidoreductase, partial [Nitrospiria bacterium]|nr:FAD-binding oxidoreductase [Nitrospiria bacterium]
MPLDLDLLRKTLGSSKVLSDSPSITAYSVDAGIYKIPPQAIVLLESGEDMERVMAFSRQHQVPLTARSGGTNLAGNAIGPGIVLEFSRMNRLLEIDGRNGWARVEPGMVYAEMNRELSKFGWMYGPDPSSGDACKIGGMIGNNSAGPHTLKYGAVKDNLLALEILLPDGKWIDAREYRLEDPDFLSLQNEIPAIGELVRIVRENQALLLDKKKRVKKNSSGYNLFGLAEGVRGGVFPLHLLFTGSEGTLGLVREAKLRLARKPPEAATALIYFKSLREMSDAVGKILGLSPSALEMMDRNSLDLVGRGKFGIPPDAEALLLAEFDETVQTKMGHLREVVSRYDLSVPIAEAYDPERQAELWRARKGINPALYRFDPGKKPIHFVDDVVVPQE